MPRGFLGPSFGQGWAMEGSKGFLKCHLSWFYLSLFSAVGERQGFALACSLL